MHHHRHMEVRRQLTGARSPFGHVGREKEDLGHQVWWQVPCPAETPKVLTSPAWCARGEDITNLLWVVRLASVAACLDSFRPL